MGGKNSGCPKLTVEKITQFCTIMREGNTLTCAQDLTPIPEKSYWRYFHRGVNDLENSVDTIYAKFVTELKKAESDAERFCTERVMAAEKNWQAAAWWLERRRRTHYALQNERLQKLEETVNQLTEALTKYISLPAGLAQEKSEENK